jgi:hypothetical protein
VVEPETLEDGALAQQAVESGVGEARAVGFQVVGAELLRNDHNQQVRLAQRGRPPSLLQHQKQRETGR